MFKFLRRLLQGQSRAADHVDRLSSPENRDRTGPRLSVERVPGGAPERPSAPSRENGQTRFSDRYFALSAEIEDAQRQRDYSRAISATRQTYPLMKSFVTEWRREFGSFDIQTSHAIHTGGTLMAVMGDRTGLKELRTVLQDIADLRPWLGVADQADRDADLIERIMEAVSAEPGRVQSGLKTVLHEQDGRRLSTLVAWLEKASRIDRVPTERSFRLYLKGHVPQTSEVVAGAADEGRRVQTSVEGPPSLPATLRPKRTERALPPRELKLDAVPFVRLPASPPKWASASAVPNAGLSGQHVEPAEDSGSAANGKADLFAVDGDGWIIASVEKLRADERPDPAFRKVFHTAGGTYWLDPKGRRPACPDAVSVLRRTGRDGVLVAERALAHDTYRSDVNVDGSAILFLSRAGVLHGYASDLSPFVFDSLPDVPEYEAAATRFSIQPSELKNHVRCVAISSSRNRYLFTVVDEAWCVDVGGQPLWGVRLPHKEGWTRVSGQRSMHAAPDSQILEALRLMQLELPVSPEDITHQYRRLALIWHPDRNVEDPTATERMQRLNVAMELLTGIDLSSMARNDIESATYQRIIHRDSFHAQTERGALGFEIVMSIGGSEASAADWVYAAAYSAAGDQVYLAGYSGKVVALSSEGTPGRVYDIGAVPRGIYDTGSHLYLLTDTRLYVLAGDRLECLKDVSGGAHLIPTENGFALLGETTLEWHSPEGRRLGGLHARHPIRRAYHDGTSLVLETRQHRAVVAGAQPWW